MPIKEKKRVVTAKDVALACHVSQATVSYVINDKPGKNISEKTRELILRTAREMNYYPNVQAQNMRRQNCMSIGLVTGNNVGNLGFNRILLGIKKYLDSQGYTITLLSEAAEYQQEECLKAYYSNTISGLIFVSMDSQSFNLEEIEKNQIPYVVVSENGVRTKGMGDKTAFENVIRDCVEFCKEKGLRRIRYFTVKRYGRVFHNKYLPLQGAIDDIYPESDFKRIILETETGREEEIMPLLEDYVRHNDFDIAITPNQTVGLLMQGSILSNHFTVPQAIKHICLVSSPIFKTIYPSITSLNIPFQEMGSHGAELLISLIEGHPIAARDFCCSLVFGTSTMIQGENSAE